MFREYINYHRQPRVHFLSIDEYNRRFDKNVREDVAFETNFHQEWKRVRARSDPNEYIQHQFQNTSSRMPRRVRAMKKKPQVMKMKPFTPKVDLKEDIALKEETARTAAPATSEETSKVSIDNFLDDYNEEEEYEGDYEEVDEVATKEKLLADIQGYVKQQAKDTSSFERDMAHVVHFNTGNMNLSARLMKGRDRYMSRLQSYVDGDSTVKVRMMNNKEIFVSELNPNKDSLRSMLAMKSGEPRFCECN